MSYKLEDPIAEQAKKKVENIKKNKNSDKNEVSIDGQVKIEDIIKDAQAVCDQIYSEGNNSSKESLVKAVTQCEQKYIIKESKSYEVQVEKINNNIPEKESVVEKLSTIKDEFELATQDFKNELSNLGQRFKNDINEKNENAKEKKSDFDYFASQQPRKKPFTHKGLTNPINVLYFLIALITELSMLGWIIADYHPESTYGAIKLSATNAAGIVVLGFFCGFFYRLTKGNWNPVDRNNEIPANNLYLKLKLMAPWVPFFIFFYLMLCTIINYIHSLHYKYIEMEALMTNTIVNNTYLPHEFLIPFGDGFMAPFENNSYMQGLFAISFIMFLSSARIIYQWKPDPILNFNKLYDDLLKAKNDKVEVQSQFKSEVNNFLKESKKFSSSLLKSLESLKLKLESNLYFYEQYIPLLSSTKSRTQERLSMHSKTFRKELFKQFESDNYRYIDSIDEIEMPTIDFIDDNIFNLNDRIKSVKTSIEQINEIINYIEKGKLANSKFADDEKKRYLGPLSS
ncbi:hypothetical protein N473_20930 [Pseudoalteromonas luteoviolacea CPMOR-1]|uniref:Uncharacterized protein n=1 Tax=Pseudoalteromonas luteoviolacea CPMOR-1 TaxID=1365248 RepID=A0A162BH61_9GAMM|nr:hypothetical protein [Pseudoalteromonas luteoviolacea]KZN62010.1 hypothetical protein N473_20930 [Pseudoalteromonas luteoviolacea CPMOR-1]